MRAACAIKIKKSWIFNKYIMNFRDFFPCLRALVNHCHHYTYLTKTLAGVGTQ